VEEVNEESEKKLERSLSSAHMRRPAHLALSRMLEVDRGWICNRQEHSSMLSGHKQKCGPPNHRVRRIGLCRNGPRETGRWLVVDYLDAL